MESSKFQIQPLPFPTTNNSFIQAPNINNRNSRSRKRRSRSPPGTPPPPPPRSPLITPISQPFQSVNINHSNNYNNIIPISPLLTININEVQNFALKLMKSIFYDLLMRCICPILPFKGLKQSHYFKLQPIKNFKPLLNFIKLLFI